MSGQAQRTPWVSKSSDCMKGEDTAVGTMAAQ